MPKKRELGELWVVLQGDAWGGRLQRPKPQITTCEERWYRTRSSLHSSEYLGSFSLLSWVVLLVCFHLQVTGYSLALSVLFKKSNCKPGRRKYWPLKRISIFGLSLSSATPPWISLFLLLIIPHSIYFNNIRKAYYFLSLLIPQTGTRAWISQAEKNKETREETRVW